MPGHALEAVFGFIGGVITGGLHFAWKFTRNNRTTSGSIDLSRRGPSKKKGGDADR
jgi:hypothetical protein